VVLALAADEPGGGWSWVGRRHGSTACRFLIRCSAQPGAGGGTAGAGTGLVDQPRSGAADSAGNGAHAASGPSRRGPMWRDIAAERVEMGDRGGCGRRRRCPGA